VGVVLAACKNHWRAVQYAGPDAMNDERFKKFLSRCP